jgi:subtilase family protein
MARQADPEHWQYRPGEMVVAAELTADRHNPRQIHADVRAAIAQHLQRDEGAVFARRQNRLEPVMFTAPGQRPLCFFFFDLAEPSHALVKDVVQRVHEGYPRAFSSLAPTVSPLGVMPHWLGSAQQNHYDGGPAGLPRPIAPPGPGRWRYHNTPRSAPAEFLHQELPAEARVPVIILDTHPHLDASPYAQVNAQLEEVVRVLQANPVPEWNVNAVTGGPDEPVVRLGNLADGRVRGHDITDHALFIAGLIHDLAPGADLSLRPVLNRYGVGDMYVLLKVLADIVDHKRSEQPSVLNMSFGFLPKLEHLPWMWFGVPQERDRSFRPDLAVPSDARSWAERGVAPAEADQSGRLLHGGLDVLSRYLLANNLLCVAAAGNDSAQRAAADHPRLGARVPARYESVLGVAATLRNGVDPAIYSNMGDGRELGDHVSTFGGDLDLQADAATDGLVSVFTTRLFPDKSSPAGDPNLANTNGFANWSGTSFAAAIVSGLVANYWASARAAGRELAAASVLEEFNTQAPTYSPALRTPSVGLDGRWMQVSD